MSAALVCPLPGTRVGIKRLLFGVWLAVQLALIIVKFAALIYLVSDTTCRNLECSKTPIGIFVVACIVSGTLLSYVGLCCNKVEICVETLLDKMDLEPEYAPLPDNGDDEDGTDVENMSNPLVYSVHGQQ